MVDRTDSFPFPSLRTTRIYPFNLVGYTLNLYLPNRFQLWENTKLVNKQAWVVKTEATRSLQKGRILSIAMCPTPNTLRYDGSFSLMLWPALPRMGRITSDVVRGWAHSALRGGEGKGNVRHTQLHLLLNAVAKGCA